MEIEDIKNTIKNTIENTVENIKIKYKKPSLAITNLLKKDKKFYDLCKNILYWCESIQELSKCLELEIFEFPKCPYCESKRKFIGKSEGYRKTCGKRECYQKELEKTWIEKYGVSNPIKSKKIKEKIKQTNLERYGVDCPLKSKEIQEKSKQTLLKKYNADNPLKSEEIKEKIKKTNLKRYGTKYTFQSEIIKEKIKQTNLERYGFDNPTKSKEIKEKIKKIWIEKYNGHPLKSKEIQEKQIKSKRENLKKKYQLKYMPVYISIFNYYNENLDMINASKICEDFNLNYTEIYKIWKYFNIEIPYYFQSNSSSKYEREIIEYIKSFYNGEIQTNIRKIISPYELDIYIPEYNFAIEFDGDYWHQDTNTDKYNLCLEKGIHLFTIKEYEWTDSLKKDIWKSKIAIKMRAPFIQKIYARNCIIKEIDSKTAKKFLEENHLQGYIASKYKFGLFYKNELVSVMTFGKSRFKKDEFELYRFASKKYTIIIGAFSKLLNYGLNNITELKKYKLISYGNKRWTYKENIYENFFILDSETPPNYFYIKNGIIYPRQKFQKHRLKKYYEEGFLKFYDENLSEKEILMKNGYYISYDYGNYKYILKEIKND